MIFYVLHVAENNVNLIYHEISDKILQHVKLSKLLFVKLCFKKKTLLFSFTI